MAISSPNASEPARRRSRYRRPGPLAGCRKSCSAARLQLGVLGVVTRGQDGYDRPGTTGLGGDHADPDRQVLPVLLLDLAGVKLTAPGGKTDFRPEDLPQVLDLLNGETAGQLLFELRI